MELQYAILCNRIDIPEADNEELLLSVPVIELIMRGYSGAGFPILVSFINSTEGRHEIRVECSDFAGDIISTTNHTLACERSSASCYDSFIVKFPIHKTDLLEFTIYLDGKKQRTIKLPIRVLEEGEEE